MSNESQLKKRIEIPKEFGPTERQALASKVIEHIQKRTENNLDIENKKFTKYSDAYINSPAFKIAGKSPTDVNLKLSGEMMQSIELIAHGNGFIQIGFESGTEANNKAVWTQADDNGPSRMFLGVDDKILERLIAEVNVESPDLNNFAQDLASKTAKSILKRLGF